MRRCQGTPCEHDARRDHHRCLRGQSVWLAETAERTSSLPARGRSSCSACALAGAAVGSHAGQDRFLAHGLRRRKPSTAQRLHTPRRPDSETVARPSGSLCIDPIPIGQMQHRAIDRLLQSAAHVWGCRVVAVILSGCSGAGTEGLRAVEHAAGVAIVQEPDEAVVSEMPRHALTYDNPHHVAPIDGIVELLRWLTQQQPI